MEMNVPFLNTGLAIFILYSRFSATKLVIDPSTLTVPSNGNNAEKKQKKIINFRNLKL